MTGVWFPVDGRDSCLSSLRPGGLPDPIQWVRKTEIHFCGVFQGKVVQHFRLIYPEDDVVVILRESVLTSRHGVTSRKTEPSATLL